MSKKGLEGRSVLIFEWENASFSKTTLLQREPFLTVSFIYKQLSIARYQVSFYATLIASFWVITNSVQWSLRVYKAIIHNKSSNTMNLSPIHRCPCECQNWYLRRKHGKCERIDNGNTSKSFTFFSFNTFLYCMHCQNGV